MKPKEKPSSNAIIVAKAVAFVLSQPETRHLMPPETLALQLEMLKPVAKASALKRLLRQGWFRESVKKFEDRVFPGLSLHFVLRKRIIEKWAREAIDKGADQLVVLGAGFDTLAARIAAEFPQVNCVEVDRLATQLRKRSANINYPRNLNFVACDLRETPLQTALLHTPAYHRHRTTFFVAEGVMKYLTAEAVDAIFSFVADDCGPNSRIAFTFLGTGMDGKPQYPEHSFIADLYVNVKRQNLLWGIEPESMHQFLNDRYMSLIEMDDAHEIALKALGARRVPAEPYRAEYTALAEQVLFR